MSTVIIPKPEWDRHGDEFVFSWPAYGITVKISRIRERGEGVSGELAITMDNHLVDVCRLSFLTPRERSALAKHLNGRIEGIEWADMLTQVSAITVEQYRLEDPSEDTAIGEIETLSYLVDPTLKRNLPTMLFGDFATGKTTLAYAHAISVGYNMPLPGGLKPRRTGPVLILDWEMGVNNVKSTIRALLRGFELSPKPDAIIVKHLVRPLTDSAESLRADIARGGYALVIVDSQSQAMDTVGLGDPSGPVKEMIRALASFNTTSLIIGQVSKAESRRDGTREPYGSRHISYLCDDTWEIRGAIDPETQAMTTVMYHRKHRGPWSPPFAFTVEFPQEGVRLLRAGRIPNDPEIVGGDTQGRRILAFLVSHGEAEVAEISEATGIPNNQVRARLSDLKVRQKVIRKGDSWGAMARRVEGE